MMSFDPDDPELGGGEEGGLVALPAFEEGGRVERTGIALVHEGEWIVPTRDSEAVIAALTTSSSDPGSTQTVDYHFPVQIEVIGELGETHLKRIAEYVYDDLNAALRALA